MILSSIEQKLVILRKSGSSILSFMDYAFGVIYKSHCCTQGHFGFLFCSVLGGFTVLHFIVRSVIHFELMFVKGIKSMSRFFFFFLHVDVQLFQHLLLNRPSLCYFIALAPLSTTI